MRLLKNWLLNSSYQVLLIVIPLITAPYLSRVLEKTGIGIYTVTLANTQFFVLFATLGTMNYGNREIAYVRDDQEKRSQTFWGITFLSWVTSGFAIAAFVIFLQLIGDYQQIYLWQGIAILTSMFDISWYFMGRENFRIIVLRNVIIRVLMVVLIFALVHQPSDLATYVAIWTLGNLAGSLSLWPIIRKEVLPPRWRGLRLGHHLRGTIWLFLPTVANLIYTQANKSMIGAMDSTTAAGFFNQSDTVIKVALSLVMSLGTIMLPHIAAMRARGDIQGVRESIYQTFNINTGVACAIYFGLSAIALKFAPFFFSAQFTAVGPIMMVEAPIVIVIAWASCFGSQYLIPMNRANQYTLALSVGVVVNVGLNLLFIPWWGVIGATVVTLVTECCVTAAFFFQVRKDFDFKRLFAGTWKYLVSGLVMFSVVFVINQAVRMTVWTLILQIAVGAGLYVTLNIVLRTQLWLFAQKTARPLLLKLIDKQ